MTPLIGLQVLRHRIFAYQCVVIDWERRCSAPDDWCRRMGVHQLRHGVDQPFYHVLVEGHRSALYVPQGTLPILVSYPCPDPSLQF